jgi:hypothetical protein
MDHYNNGQGYPELKLTHYLPNLNIMYHYLYLGHSEIFYYV